MSWRCGEAVEGTIDGFTSEDCPADGTAFRASGASAATLLGGFVGAVDGLATGADI